MNGFDEFYGPSMYGKVPRAYADWCRETTKCSVDECWRSGQQIADAIDEMILTK
jgi:hypothetical protein